MTVLAEPTVQAITRCGQTINNGESYLTRDLTSRRPRGQRWLT